MVGEQELGEELRTLRLARSLSLGAAGGGAGGPCRPRRSPTRGLRGNGGGDGPQPDVARFRVRTAHLRKEAADEATLQDDAKGVAPVAGAG